MIYLDNGATSFPKPEEVYIAVCNNMRNTGGNPGRSGHKMALEAGRLVYEVREKVADFFNISNPMNIVFTLNATDSLNMAIKGYLKEEDHVITTSMEHNSVIRPLKKLEKEGKIKLDIIKCDKEGNLDIKEIKKLISKKTSMIVATHASNVTGTILPIHEIGKLSKENNIVFMVDSAQTAGVYDIDVDKMNIDILAFTGHKSLLGPQGVGGLYIRENIIVDSFREGGTGSSSESLYQPDIMPDKMEAGTPNTHGIIGLGAGIDYIKKIGIENIRKQEKELTNYFLEKLRNLEKIKIYGTNVIENRGPVVSINIGNEDSSEISYILDEVYNIATRPGLHCSPLAHDTIGTLERGTVRFSFGFFNTKEEVDYVINSIINITENI